MSIYGLFASPSLGMLTQSSAFGTISQNITNLNTGGYKATDTRFSTILASTFDTNSDVGGVKALRKTYVAQQGNTISTTNYLDLAVNGKGMFVLNTKVEGSGDELYSRDGAFQIFAGDTATTTVNSQEVEYNEGYLIDKNGYFLQGWTPDDTGAFSTSGPLTSTRIDRFAFTSDSAASTNASLALNLPATLASGESKTTNASVYAANGTIESLGFVWTKTANPQEWTLTIDPTDGTSTSTQTFTFDNTGHLPDGTTFTVAVNWDDGQTSSVDVDLSDVTSIGSNFIYFDFQKDGRTAGDLDTFYFNKNGEIIGHFSNGVERALYKLPLATFTSFDQLEVRQGNLFAESTGSGEPVYREAGLDSFAIFTPYAHELSNTNLADEFTKMIMVQQAYNTSATVFKTVDEMTRTASQLKT